MATKNFMMGAVYAQISMSKRFKIKMQTYTFFRYSDGIADSIIY